MSATQPAAQESAGRKRGHVRMGTFGPWNPEIYDGMFPNPDYPPSKNWGDWKPRSRRSSRTSEHQSRSNRTEDGPSVYYIQDSDHDSRRRGTLAAPDDVLSLPKATSRQDPRPRTISANHGESSRLRTSSQTSIKSSSSIHTSSTTHPRRAMEVSRATSSSSMSSAASSSLSGNLSSSSTLVDQTPLHTPSKAQPESTAATARPKAKHSPEGPRARTAAAQPRTTNDESISQSLQGLKLPSPPKTSSSSPVQYPQTIPSASRSLLTEAAHARQRTNSRPTTSPLIARTSSTPNPDSDPRAPPTPPKSPDRMYFHRVKPQVSFPPSASSTADPPSFTNPFTSPRKITAPRLQMSLSSPPTSGSHPFEATFLQSPSSPTFSEEDGDPPSFTNPFGGVSSSAGTPTKSTKKPPMRSQPSVQFDISNSPRKSSMAPTSPRSPTSPTSSLFAASTYQFPATDPNANSAMSKRPTSPLATASTGRRTSLQIPTDLNGIFAFRKTSLPNCLGTITEGSPPNPQLGQYASLGRANGMLSVTEGSSNGAEASQQQKSRLSLRKWSQKIDPGRDSTQA